MTALRVVASAIAIGSAICWAAWVARDYKLGRWSILIVWGSTYRFARAEHPDLFWMGMALNSLTAVFLAFVGLMFLARP